MTLRSTQTLGQVNVDVRSFDVLEITVGRRMGGVLSVREVVRRLLREDLVRESRYLFLSLMN